MHRARLSRREALAGGIAAIATAKAPGALAQPAIGRPLPREFNLVLEHRTMNITGRTRPAMLINGQLPAPPLRFREGEEVVVNVSNRLREHTSIHWHGLILPSDQDGVPGISDGFQGIPAGTTHTYRFRLIQSGTYWYHSHSATQEQSGIYGPIIIDPAQREPFDWDQDYIVQFSDWTDERPERIIENLKRDPSYYNYNRRTLAGLVRDLLQAPNSESRSAVISDRMMWGNMRMDPTDIEDVTGYTYLVNGRTPAQNFTAVYQAGDRIRLRFINSGAMTHFDLRIPGLKMVVVQAHGNNVQPVEIDELRIAPAETYDVIVQPRNARQYQILAESMGRQGFASASLATQEGLPALPLPPHRPRPVLTMADMGMNYGPTGLDRGTPHPEVDRPGEVAPMGAMGMPGMDQGSMSEMDHSSMQGMNGSSMPGMDHSSMPGMSHEGMAGMNHGGMASMEHSSMPGMNHSLMPGMNHGPMPRMNHGSDTSPPQTEHAGISPSGQSATAPGGMYMQDPWANNTQAPPGTKVLSVRDLRAVAPKYPDRAPDRIIEVRLTGNMERYFWAINGNRFSEAQPIVFNYGERVRLRFINETMMNHPMHLHGMWMIPQVGNGAQNPMLHVVNVRPGVTLDVDVPADAEGGWAFHCHMLYHMETGMMRKVSVLRREMVSTR